MAIIVNTNISSLVSQRNLTNATNSLNQSLQRMSTGFKINSAKDDAAGMYIATNLDTQIRGSKVAQSNVATGSNMLQVAEGDLDVIKTNLQRIRDLAVQASNGVYSADSLAAMQKEVTARTAEITRTATASQFNGLNLLDGSTADLRLQVGANAEANQNALTVDGTIFAAADADALNLTTAAVTAAFAGATAAAAFITTVDTALTNINTRKSDIGALQNRLDSAATSLVTNIENSSAAKSTIMDADIAEESSAYTKAQILQQTSAALLTQANQLPSLALKLIS